MKNKIEVGQVLYREKKYNSKEIEEVTVGKVGKKFIYLTGWEARYPIDKETLRYTSKKYSDFFQLYVDKQEILDIREKERLKAALVDYLHKSGGYRNNTLEQLRKAVEALGINTEEKP